MSRNTKLEWDTPPLDGEIIQPSRTDDVAAKLEGDLQQERDSRREERFYWILALVIMFDAYLFGTIGSQWAMLPIFLLEIVGLIGLADWLGVDRVKVLLERLYAKWLDRKE